MRYRLEGLFDLQMGKTPARANPDYWNGSNKWVSISDLSGYDKYVTDTKECISDLGVSESGIKAVPNNTVIMSFKLSIGKTAITTEDIYTNEAIMAFIDKGVCEIDTDYLYYLFSGMNWNKGTNKAVLGLTLNKATLSKKEIDIPDLHTQNEVVKKLDSLSNVIQLQKQSLDKLDELIKSRFVEMFGDPIINPYNWDELLIANVLRGKASNGFFAKRDEYCDNGNVSILGVTNIVNRMYSNCDNLPKTNANNTSIEKYRVQYGDMLFCRSSLVAEGIGKASIVPTNIPDNVLFECHVIRLPLDTNKVIPEFLQVLTSLDYFRNQVLASAKTATMTTIGQDGILKCNIILPPYIMQQEYLTYISRIKKTKSAVNQSIEKLETLKESLMQEYFQ